MLQTVWNTTGGVETQGVFTVVLLAVIVGWILVSLWTRVIENVAFGDLGFNENSSWDAALIAFSVTAIFIAFVVMVDKYGFVTDGLNVQVRSEEDFDNLRGNQQLTETPALSLNTNNHLGQNNNGNPLAIF